MDTVFHFLNNRALIKKLLTSKIATEHAKASLSLPEPIMKTCSVVLIFESVDEFLWYDHSNETSLAVLLHGTICFSIFYKMKFGIFLEF